MFNQIQINFHFDSSGPVSFVIKGSKSLFIDFDRNTIEPVLQ